MLRRFLLTLLSSWVATPLGVLIAHFVGVSNEPVVLLVLLGMGAAAPFQIFLNECIAVARARTRLAHARRWQIFVVLAQIATCALAMWFLPYRNAHVGDVILVALLLGASSALSYQTAVHYYRQVMLASISLREAVIVGALPGASTLLIFVLFAMVSALHRTSPYWLLAIALVPAIFQWRFASSRTSVSTDLSEPTFSQFPIGKTSTALVLLIVLSFIGTRLRDGIAGADNQFTALIIVSLSALMSLLTTVTRALHLRKMLPQIQLTLWITSTLLGVASILLFKTSNVAWQLTALFSTQCGIVAVVTAGRKIVRVVPTYPA